jgi:hypothetical protein
VKLFHQIISNSSLILNPTDNRCVAADVNCTFAPVFGKARNAPTCAMAKNTCYSRLNGNVRKHCEKVTGTAHSDVVGHLSPTITSHDCWWLQSDRILTTHSICDVIGRSQQQVTTEKSGKLIGLNMQPTLADKMRDVKRLKSSEIGCRTLYPS